MNKYVYTLLLTCCINTLTCAGGGNNGDPQNPPTHVKDSEGTNRSSQGTPSSNPRNSPKRTRTPQKKDENIKQLINYGISTNDFERVVQGWNDLGASPSRTHQWALLLGAAQANQFVQEKQVEAKITSLLSKDIKSAQDELAKASQILIFIEMQHDRTQIVAEQRSFERKEFNKQMPVDLSQSGF